MPKLNPVVTHFRPLHRNTLRGFCNVYIVEPRLVVRDVAVHQYASGGQLGGVAGPAGVVDNGVLRLTDAGKIEYAPVLLVRQSCSPRSVLEGHCRRFDQVRPRRLRRCGTTNTHSEPSARGSPCVSQQGRREGKNYNGGR